MDDNIIFIIFDYVKNFLYYYYMVYNNNNNYYSIVDFPETGKYYGKFSGTIPKKVASKAFSSLIKFINIDFSKEDVFLGKFVVFVIKNMETGKMYKYIGSRIKLENPIKVFKNNKEIEYKYKNIIGKYNKDLDLI